MRRLQWRRAGLATSESLAGGKRCRAPERHVRPDTVREVAGAQMPAYGENELTVGIPRAVTACGIASARGSR